MSKAVTELSAEQLEIEEACRKMANAAAIRGGLAGVRWLLSRVAGPAASGVGARARFYNYGLRPLRAILLPNLGRAGNMARAGAAAYSAGSVLASADNKYLKHRQQLLLAAKDSSPEMKKLIADRSTRLGAIGAAFRASTGMLQSGAPLANRLADDVAKEGISKAFREGAAEHRDKVYGGKTVSSWLNPIGSRVLSSGLVGIGGKEKTVQDYASQFGSKYKNMLGATVATGLVRGAMTNTK